MEFRVLGPLEVVAADGQQIEVRGSKLRALLAALLLRAGQRVSPDQLGEVLWGGSPPETAANALQSQISKLRKLLADPLGVSPVENRDGGYVLLVEPSALDANRFVELTTSGRQYLASGQTADAASVLRRALALWRGPALSDFVFDEFADASRARLDDMRVAAAEDLFAAELAEGNHHAITAEIEAWLVDTPLREGLWHHLMLALYRSGRQADALRAYQRARDHLAEELGLDPGPELQQLERQILDQDPSLMGPARVPVPTARQTNVYPELSSFVGRTTEHARVSALVRDKRLVTLTGPGGIGKTRLAVEVAVAVTDTWRDGTWIVELGPDDGPSAVALAFSRTFGPRLGNAAGDQSVEWLANGLASTELLIVVDNCEHVLESAAQMVNGLLRSCPGVHVLATSREPLGVSGETELRINPLDLADAVALFAHRAADSAQGFVLDEESSDAVHTICEQVDRLPLAIELTAARTRAFSARQLAELVDRQFGIVSSSSSTRPSRHRNLHAAVDWSYGLLFEDERVLLDRLSVFAGGFTLEAAVEVCADSRLISEDIGLVLARLVEKSLVVRSSGPMSANRFHLLHAVQSYAATRLADAGDTGNVRGRHLAWTIALTAGLTEGLRGKEKFQWAHRVNAELHNMAHAMRWALSDGDAVAGVQLCVNVGWYAFLSANVQDDQLALLRLVRRAGDTAPPVLRCQAKIWAGLLGIGRTGERTWALDAIDVARTTTSSSSKNEPDADSRTGLDLSLEAIDIARELDDPDLVIDAIAIGALHLAAVGSEPAVVRDLVAEARQLCAGEPDPSHARRRRWMLTFLEGLDGLADYVAFDNDGASKQLTAAIRSMRQLDDDGTACFFDVSLAEVIELQADVRGAAAAIERAMVTGSEAGFQSALILRSVLTWLTGRYGDTERALLLGQQAVDEVRPPFNPILRAQALFALGYAEFRAGLDEPASAHIDEARALHDRFGMNRELALDHCYLGGLAQRSGRMDEAVTHHHRAVNLAAGVGLPWTIMLTSCFLAESLVASGRFESGCEVIGLVTALSAQHAYPLIDVEREQIEAARERAVHGLGSEAAAKAERAGATTTAEDILGRCLAIC